LLFVALKDAKAYLSIADESLHAATLALERATAAHKAAIDERATAAEHLRVAKAEFDAAFSVDE